MTDIVIGVGSALVIAGALVLVWLTFAPKPDTGGPELTPPSLQVKPEHMTGPRVAQPGAGPDAPPHKPGGPSNSTSVPKD